MPVLNRRALGRVQDAWVTYKPALINIYREDTTFLPFEINLKTTFEMPTVTTMTAHFLCFLWSSLTADALSWYLI